MLYSQRHSFLSTLPVIGSVANSFEAIKSGNNRLSGVLSALMIIVATGAFSYAQGPSYIDAMDLLQSIKEAALREKQFQLEEHYQLSEFIRFNILQTIAIISILGFLCRNLSSYVNQITVSSQAPTGFFWLLDKSAVIILILFYISAAIHLVNFTSDRDISEFVEGLSILVLLHYLLIVPLAASIWSILYAVIGLIGQVFGLLAAPTEQQANTNKGVGIICMSISVIFALMILGQSINLLVEPTKQVNSLAASFLFFSLACSALLFFIANYKLVQYNARVTQGFFIFKSSYITTKSSAKALSAEEKASYKEEFFVPFWIVGPNAGVLMALLIQHVEFGVSNFIFTLLGTTLVIALVQFICMALSAWSDHDSYNERYGLGTSLWLLAYIAPVLTLIVGVFAIIE